MKKKKTKPKIVFLRLNVPEQIADQLSVLQAFYTCSKKGQMMEDLIFQRMLEIGSGLEPAGLTPVQRKAFLYCQWFASNLLDMSAPKRCMKLLLKPKKEWPLSLKSLFDGIRQCRKKPKKSKSK